MNIILEQLQMKLQRQANSLKYYTDAALKEAGELQRNAILLYEASETSMTDLVQSLHTSINIHKQYIEALQQYNLTAIELELYTK